MEKDDGLDASIQNKPFHGTVTHVWSSLSRTLVRRVKAERTSKERLKNIKKFNKKKKEETRKSTILKLYMKRVFHF